MAVQVVTRGNLGTTLVPAVKEAGKVDVALGYGLRYNPTTEVVELDGSILPADVFVVGGAFNPATQTIDLTLNNGSVISIPAASLLPVAADGATVAGNGAGTPLTANRLVNVGGGLYQWLDASGAPLFAFAAGLAMAGGGLQVVGSEVQPDFDGRPLEPLGSQAPTDHFVMSTSASPDGARVPLANVGELVYNYCLLAGKLDVQTGAGVSGDSVNTPLALAADELPLAVLASGEPLNQLVLSTPSHPAGQRASMLNVAQEVWTQYVAAAAQAQTAGLVALDVQDAFGLHLFFARE